MITGGGGEIRTLGGLSPSLVFKTSAFNRSATPPRRKNVTLTDVSGGRSKLPLLVHKPRNALISRGLQV